MSIYRTNKHIQHDAKSIDEFHTVRCNFDAITANLNLTQFHAHCEMSQNENVI